MHTDAYGTSTIQVNVPFETLSQATFDAARGLDLIYSAMRCLYDNYQLIKANPKIDRLRALMALKES